MRPLINEVETTVAPDSLAEQLVTSVEGLVLLRSGGDFPQARYSLIAANPFMVFRSFGSRCETTRPASFVSRVQFGNPLQILSTLMARFELLDELDLPFPLGGCFGFWGYDLKNFTEPKLPRRALNDLDLPDCHAGFYDSLVIFDHQLGKTFVVSTGLDADGSRSDKRAHEQFEFWRQLIESTVHSPQSTAPGQARSYPEQRQGSVVSNFTRQDFISAVKLAQEYIRAGDIYQVNLSQRLTAPRITSSWELFQRLNAVSPAPFAALLDCSDFQIASSSPEQFLRLSGPHIITRPIKGTRPRDTDATRDAQLAYELQTSAKELAELIMITDLLRNDLGKICEFGSVQVPELAKLEKFAQVCATPLSYGCHLRSGPATASQSGVTATALQDASVCRTVSNILAQQSPDREGGICPWIRITPSISIPHGCGSAACDIALRCPRPRRAGGIPHCAHCGALGHPTTDFPDSHAPVARAVTAVAAPFAKSAVTHQQCQDSPRT